MSIFLIVNIFNIVSTMLVYLIVSMFKKKIHIIEFISGWDYFTLKNNKITIKPTKVISV